MKIIFPRYALPLIVGLLYCLLRIFWISTAPPFTDESLYIRWGQLMLFRDSLRFASIEYLSRQPLGMWLFGIGGFAFQEPLIGARIITFLTTIPVLLITWVISKKYYGSHTAMIATFLLSVSPLFIHIQSYALLDGFIFTVASMILYVFLTKTTFQGMWLGMLIGIGLWMKSTTILICVTLFSALIFEGVRLKRYRSTLFILILVVSISTIVVLPLLVQPHVGNILMEPQSFVISKYSSLLLLWMTNIRAVGISILFYFPALIFIFRKSNPVFWLWMIMPVAFVTFLGANPLARYYVVGLFPLPILAAEGIRRLSVRVPQWTIGLLFLVLCLYGAVFVWIPRTMYGYFPQHYAERSYVYGWTSGYGLDQILHEIDILLQSHQNIAIIVSDTPGNPADYVAARYYFSRNIQVQFASYSDATFLERLTPLLETAPVYLIFRTSESPSAPAHTLVHIVSVPIDTADALNIYRVVSTK